jgi:hypothetical protein
MTIIEQRRERFIAGCAVIGAVLIAAALVFL